MVYIRHLKCRVRKDMRVRLSPRAQFMQQFLRNNLLSAVVFITGASVLVIEVVAVRILSPYYGNTIFTVSGVISTILIALSLGYYAGGKLVDRYPSLQWFFGIITLSGLGLLFFHFLGLLILPIFSVSLPILTGPLASSIFLFLFPALLLGMLSPFAIKLQSIQLPQKGVGSVSGDIFFWSTVGSISGSLLAGFLLIPNFGINQIIIFNSVILFFLGFVPFIILGSGKKHFNNRLLFLCFIIFFIILGASRTVTGGLGQKVVYEKDGVYEKNVIYDGEYAGRPVRFFQQDRSHSGAMFLDSEDPTDLVYDYTKYHSLYEIFTPSVKNALVVGGGAYLIPKALLRELPDAVVDVAEIEPLLFDLAKKYFGLVESQRLHNFTEDGRRFLYDYDGKYDLIFGDAYYSLFSVPIHMTTLEFFNIVKNKLSDGGVFIANIIGGLSPQPPSFVMSEIKTFKKAFPNSYFFAVGTPGQAAPQNIIFVGYNSEKTMDFDDPSITSHHNPIISLLYTKIIDADKFDLSSHPLLTDNFSPVEYMTARALRRMSF